VATKCRNVRFTRCLQLSLGNLRHSLAKSSFSQDFLAKTINFFSFFSTFFCEKPIFTRKKSLVDYQGFKGDTLSEMTLSSKQSVTHVNS
jgi:hypothetical protein